MQKLNKPYCIYCTNIDETIYDTFIENVQDAGLKVRGHQAKVNRIKTSLFEEALDTFNKDPKKWLNRHKNITE